MLKYKASTVAATAKGKLAPPQCNTSRDFKLSSSAQYNHSHWYGVIKYEFVINHNSIPIKLINQILDHRLGLIAAIQRSVSPLGR